MSNVKAKPPKKYTKEEQLKRRQEDSIAITGGKDLTMYSKAIQDSTMQANEQRKSWQRSMGTPELTCKVDDYSYAFWNVPEGILVARIDKRGPNPASAITYSVEFIEALNKLKR